MVARKPLQGCHERGVNSVSLLLRARVDRSIRRCFRRSRKRVTAARGARRAEPQSADIEPSPPVEGSEFEFFLRGSKLCMTRHHLFNPVGCNSVCGELPERSVSAPVARGSTSPAGFIIGDQVAFRPCQTESTPRVGSGGWHALLGSLARADAPGFLLF